MIDPSKEARDRASFQFSKEEISTFASFLIKLRNHNYLMSDEEFRQDLKTLSEISRVRLERKIYAFHVEDTMAEHLPDIDTDQEYATGIELYILQGNLLKQFYVYENREHVYSAEDCAKYLKSQEITTVYTGAIEKEFFGLRYHQKGDFPVFRSPLDNDDEIVFDEEAGIEVIFEEL